MGTSTAADPKTARRNSISGVGRGLSTGKGENADNRILKDNVKRLLRISMNLKISFKQVQELEEKVAKFDQKADKRIDFVAFLKIMRWLLDSNFAGINDVAAEVAEQNALKYFAGA